MPIDLVLPGTLAACIGVLMLRLVWGRPRRSPALNGAAWAMVLVGSALGGASSGAWGLAMVVVAAMATAMLLLSVAAVKAPAGKPLRVASRRVAGDSPPPPRMIGRRIVTLLLTGPAPMIVALLLALALRAVADMAGWSQANSNVLCLLMMRRRNRQLLLLSAAGISSAVILWIGSMA